jgi:hypothetical protein
MHATFVAQLLVNVLAADEEDHFLDPAFIRGAQIHRLGLPADALGVARVHARKVGREQRRFLAANARADFHDGVARVVLVRRHDSEADFLFGLGVGGPQCLELARGHLGHLGIGGVPRHFLGIGQLARELFPAIAVGEKLAQARMLTGHLLRVLRVVVEIGPRQFRFQLGVAPREPF